MKVCAKPEPGIVTIGELKPVAIALASIVLPVPGAPRKSNPRSRRPPAFSNASPDCQRLTTRRTSSFASAWPRTSLSFTPQSASPGSKPRICEMPMKSSGPIRIPKLKTKKMKKLERVASVVAFGWSFEVSQCQVSCAAPTMLASAMPYLSTCTA